MQPMQLKLQDVVKKGDSTMKVLAIAGPLAALSKIDQYEVFGGWTMIDQLRSAGWKVLEATPAPKMNYPYFRVEMDGEVRKAQWTESVIDKYCFLTGNFHAEVMLANEYREHLVNTFGPAAILPPV